MAAGEAFCLLRVVDAGELFVETPSLECVLSDVADFMVRLVCLWVFAVLTPAFLVKSREVFVAVTFLEEDESPVVADLPLVVFD
jgi:hypothetical protein